MTDPTPVLHQFLASHFNEKARWGLDWKGVAHRRVCHLPGPHAPAIRRLSGQTATPVLVIGGSVMAGSARILDELERRVPERPLLPEASEQRERALALQRDFDTELGPADQVAGECFSVADLAYAALLAPLAPPDPPDIRLPEPVLTFDAQWTGHEAVAWLREQYARHRPAPLGGAPTG